MAFEKKTIVEAVTKCLEEGKGKRKFQQSVDLAIGFKDVDFKKNENKLNLTIILPYAPKKVPVLVYADGAASTEAKKHAELVLSAAEVAEYAKDAKKAKSLLKYNSLAIPQLMATVGKDLGKYLRGKLPTVMPPNINVADAIERSRRTLVIKTKGKALPAVHCGVGNEAMSADEIAENAKTVIDALLAKFNEHQFRTVFVKTTMGKPVRVK